MNNPLRRFRLWHFIGIAVALSELLTAGMSLALKGRIERDFLITGAVVSLIAASSILFLVRRMISLMESKERLENEIRERQRVEAELRESENRYRSFVQDFKGIAYRCRPDLTPIFYHGALEEITGYRESDFIRRAPTWQNLVYTEDLERILEDNRRVEDGGPSASIDREYRIVNRRGDVRWIHEIAHPIADETGTPQYLDGVIYDVTDRVELHEKWLENRGKLEHAKRMSYLGTMVSGVAHEINNPNQMISLNTQFVQVLWPDILKCLDQYSESAGDFMLGGVQYSELKVRLPGVFSDIHMGSERITRIIQQILILARGGPTEATEPVNTNKVLETARKVITYRFPAAGESLSLDLAEWLPEIDGNQQQLEQVFINVMSNAIQALPEGRGQVVVSSRFDAAARTVTVETRDNGTGMSQETMRNVEVPFYTTKTFTDGLGLGLAISSAFVRNHNGLISYASEEGKGTVVTVSLPTGLPFPPAGNA